MTPDEPEGDDDTSVGPATHVVDANVVAKWFVEEEFSGTARGVLESPDALIAPDFLPTELGSIFRKKVLEGEMAEQAAFDAVAVALDRVRLVPCRALFDEALRLAVSTQRSFYDCLYVALAVSMETRLLTADRRLVNGLARTHKEWLIWLGDLADEV